MTAKLSLASNLYALGPQRNLAKSTDLLSRSYERLSSGLRINHASDDAAGLAIASALSSQSRIFARAIHNVNDGISVLSITDGALSELVNIVTRQIELAEQAANGTYSFTQRQALHKEANALVDEFNRITQSTSFNQISLLNSSDTEIRIQAGSGTSDSIAFSIGEELARTVGSGTYQTQVSYVQGAGSRRDVELADMNGDGILDLVATDSDALTILVSLGNGNGTFKAATSFSIGQETYRLALGDVNGDGKVDVVTTSYGSDRLTVLLGNGTGSLQAPILTSTGNGPIGVALGDVNGDGLLDLVGTSYIDGRINIHLGNGNGTFKTTGSYSHTGPTGISLGDFNNDGKIDLMAAGSSATAFFSGDGQGGFTQTSTITGTSWGVSLADVNNDGNLDAVYARTTATYVSLGNGNGTFTGLRTISAFSGTGVAQGILTADLNADGYLDVITADGNTDDAINILIGNGDGTFKARLSLAAGNQTEGLGVGDLNGDGVPDIVSSSSLSVPGVQVFLANATEVTTEQHVNLTTQAKALEALTTFQATLDRLMSERGSNGAAQSRLNTTLSVLAVTRENYLAAESRIMSVDVAEETAQLVAQQILQQAATAMLAQANQIPRVVLSLLQGSQ